MLEPSSVILTNRRMRARMSGDVGGGWVTQSPYPIQCSLIK